MSNIAALRGDHGAMLVSTATVATRHAARYADQLAAHWSTRVRVETLPGGYRLVFDIGEGLLNYGAGALLLLVSAGEHAALQQLRDALRVCLERLGRDDRVRVDWQ